MKGPFERLKYDLRRLWECPKCKRRERSDGTATTRFCACLDPGTPSGQRTVMKLVEEAGHRATPEFKYVPADDAAAEEASAIDSASQEPVTQDSAGNDPPAVA